MKLSSISLQSLPLLSVILYDAKYSHWNGHSWPLEQWHTAFETMHSRKIVKAVLTP